MINKEYLLIPLFEKFMKDTHKGRRMKADGAKVKKQTIRNYEYVLTYLKEYEMLSGVAVRIKIFSGNNKRLFLSERKYWNKFYLGFTHYLYSNKKCFDNYVGTVIKVLRIFFNYLNKDVGINAGDFYKNFHVCKEDIPIITLLPAQLQFLINDTEFYNKLTPSLQKSKDILVFGCTVALRVSDLFAVKFTDIENYETAFYLPVKTIKTGTIVRVKLPEYAMQIISIFKDKAKGRKIIFPPIPPTIRRVKAKPSLRIFNKDEYLLINHPRKIIY